jgi:hypothetical protein
MGLYHFPVSDVSSWNSNSGLVTYSRGEKVNYRLGRRPPKNSPAIRFSNILKEVIPSHPSSLDYLSMLSNWRMLGNDTYSDCLACWWANTRRLVTATLSKEYYPTLDQVLAFYKTQNKNFDPNDPGGPGDQGMEYQTALEYLNKTGGPDGVKVVAFAKVDYTNLEEMKAAIAIFGSIALGINVQDANMSEFDSGQPWDYISGSKIGGGHAVPAGGYLGQSLNDVRFITWAEETGFTDNFWKHLVEEAWVVVWPEHLGTKEFQQGIDLNALAADYLFFTGRPLPLPTPTPIPVPTPGSGCNILAKYIRMAMTDKVLSQDARFVRAAKKFAEDLEKSK